MEECRATLARLGGLAQDSREINILMNDIRVKHEEETAAGKAKWIELFTGPRMFYRVALGVVLQAGQQLTGANFVSSTFIMDLLQVTDKMSSSSTTAQPSSKVSKYAADRLNSRNL